MARIPLCQVLCILLSVIPLPRLRAAPANRLAVVDAKGVMRWKDDNTEVALFGVNYYPPFSVDFERIEARGLDHEKAIREDVEHFARLGLSAIRLHCWDRELSDHDGNLLENRHLQLLDYLIARCKENGIYSVMTPMAWWPSPSGGGFADLYPMERITSDPEVWAIECRYLVQYVNHVNRYTGLAYKSDPAIVGFEFINEPKYPPGTSDEQIVDYVNAMYDAVRGTGCEKPLFHSFFSGRQAAVAKSKVEGLTFGWYPTGLVSGGTLRSNFLPSVDDYPAMRRENVRGKAKIVYEFDAADVHDPYLYPAMARAFRGGGCQSATQFQYDPMCLAAANRNWQTHYLNLCYTPGKAISFAIAAEAFRRTPRLSRSKGYPAGNRFGAFRVSYEEKLSEMVTDHIFMYSNDTSTGPSAPESLVRIWGCGSSPVVRYGGTGAYFLDKEGDGAWRLELYPDAVIVDDPYRGGNSEKTRILWARHDMRINLPDLGSTFDVNGISTPGVYRKAAAGSVLLGPGRYILSRQGGKRPCEHPIPLVAPPSHRGPPAVYMPTPDTWREGHPLNLTASVAATDIRKCRLEYTRGEDPGFHSVPMHCSSAYTYGAVIPAAEVAPGSLELRVRVETGEGVGVFPGGKPAEEADAAIPPPIPLLVVPPDATAPPASYSGPEEKWSKSSIVSDNQYGTRALRLTSNGFGEAPSCAGVRWPAANVPTECGRCNAVTFTVRGGPRTKLVEITLVQDDGSGFGYNVPVGETWSEVTIPIGELKPMWGTTAKAPELRRLKEVTVIFGAWLFDAVRDSNHWVDVASVVLTAKPDTWVVRVAREDDPVLLTEPARGNARPTGVRAARRVVPGMDRGSRALRIAVPGFGPEPSCSTIRFPVNDAVALWADKVAEATTLIVKARAGTPRSKRVEIVLIEEDGAPWGTSDIALDTQWREIRIPFDKLRFFAHWKPACASRGKKGDRLRPAKVARISVCFGAFLYPETREQPHAIEIQEISLLSE